MTDTSTTPEGGNADTAGSLDGTQWQQKYNGLQRVLGQRTNDLTEARRIAEEAIARAEAAERQAREYADLVNVFTNPADEPAPAPPPTDDEPDVYVDANNPRRTYAANAAPPRAQTSADLEAQLRRMPTPPEWDPFPNTGGI